MDQTHNAECTMSDQSIAELLRLQNNTLTVLNEVRVDMSAVKTQLGDMRQQQQDTGERLRSAELRLERLPHIEREVLNLQSSQQGIDERVRKIELGGVKTEVAVGAASRFGWHVLTAAIGVAVSAAALWISGGAAK